MKWVIWFLQKKIDAIQNIQSVLDKCFSLAFFVWEKDVCGGGEGGLGLGRRGTGVRIGGV